MILISGSNFQFIPPVGFLDFFSIVLYQHIPHTCDNLCQYKAFNLVLNLCI